MTTPWADGFAKLNPGRIEQLTVTKTEEDARIQSALFFGEPMVGITVKQFDEYRELRARAAETCVWNRILEAGDLDDLYETACGEEFQWLGSDTSALKFCWNCGRKVEVSPAKSEPEATV